MNKFLTLVLLLTTALPASVYAQEIPIDLSATKRMEQDLFFLSSDALKGRKPGTPEADVAREYIAGKMMAYGIEPMGENGYFQKFPVPEYAAVDYDATTLSVGNAQLEGHVDFYPVSISCETGKAASKTVYVGYGITTEDGSYDDFKGLDVNGAIAVMNISSPDGIHPHSAYAAYHSLNERVASLVEKGAKGILLINPEGTASDTQEFFKSINASSLPVFFVRNEKWANKLMKRAQKTTMSVSMSERFSDGYNVIGYIHNNKRKTVVLGAHYDHLGMGGENSLYKGPAAIHNGADDNGSGTTLLLEAMRYYAQRQDTNYNYLIQFYSAEELGLIGSKYWANNPTFPLKEVEYMINSDMVGRLRDNRLQLSGTGTAVEWDEILDTPIHGLDIKKDHAGVGPSDQTSFYYKDLPVLHLFTGTHDDYHKPTDDADKINYKGMAKLASLIYTITARTAYYENVTFQKTASSEQKTTPNFSVTLGVVPDYLFGGPGLRIDGATEGRPGANAGLKAGDVIMKIGAIAIDDIYAYMTALGAFKKGDTTALVYVRDGEEVETEITF
ncbi:MAG: M28 family peptidase [Flavobacteriales bacterium]|nr:M28 family peptidase [Flavobacteriales bacterium]